MEGYKALGYIQKVTADSFKKIVQEIPAVDNTITESETEEERELENLNWKKGQGKIPMLTAPGLHGVPVSLISELEQNTKEALLKAVEKC